MPSLNSPDILLCSVTGLQAYFSESVDGIEIRFGGNIEKWKKEVAQVFQNELKDRVFKSRAHAFEFIGRFLTKNHQLFHWNDGAYSCHPGPRAFPKSIYTQGVDKDEPV